MTHHQLISPDAIRSAFSTAMSLMYCAEVPAYGSLMTLVARVNEETLDRTPALRERLIATETLARLSQERHGAIRLGTSEELSMMRRVFQVMGMFPVGYYDLSRAGVPVHSTAFRPVGEYSLNINPFRVFTSLLRLDLIKDETLRSEAADVLARRQIFTDAAADILKKAERDGGLDQIHADRFVDEILQTFRWHHNAIVSTELYERLHNAHRLVADVVSFRGPHINHLTPRTLDIDQVQARMPEESIVPKAVVEGPPTRECPILLRQTSFKALEEPVAFRDADGNWRRGSHTARFGEIEQRGVALTPKGRALYDRLLNEVRKQCRPAPDGSNAAEYDAALKEAFTAFPDDWGEMRKQKLAYFAYSLTERGVEGGGVEGDIDDAVALGLVRFDPIVYEDFLPVSAAGIFQSNLGDERVQQFVASPNQKMFEHALGACVLDEFDHYRGIVEASLGRCGRQGRQPTLADD